MNMENGMYKRRGWIFVALAITLFAGTAQAQFEGDLAFEPDGCEKQGKCYLKNILRYTDPTGLVWQADKWTDGNGESGTTDGASIPKWARPFIGKPFNTSYLKAAVIHDHYCYEENQVRTWRQTHRVFYDAMRELGVKMSKAKIMYYAVYKRGPKWVELKLGDDCGTNCINDIVLQSPGYQMPRTYSRPDTFLADNFAEELKAVEKLIEEKGDDISLEELEALAQQSDPDDFFYKHGGTYVVESGNDPVLFPVQ